MSALNLLRLGIVTAAAITALPFLTPTHSITSEVLPFLLFFQLPYLLLIAATLFPAPPLAKVPLVKFGLLAVGLLGVLVFAAVMLGGFFGIVIGGCLCALQDVFALATVFGALLAIGDAPPVTLPQPPRDTP